ncbi:VPLPA-CTERM sorting domain-containing protein [Thiocapsa bogorovii]|uniref:VPLPA-CTERM sorting domain-containing protein n=1 Tax=Thiocapsa bogorovii TaxID=521689 RepID=UPI001E352DFF|nr:VPLPA-CTERM sorting domain-containing protein [Thiocapsa bogorovii]UHD16252.1 VPLPA-CTERM sorting domain-containing protein [Thiocapsa bogorovii]
MKSMMRLSAVGSVLALAGALAFSGQAAADTVTATYGGMTQTRGVGYSVVLPPTGSPQTTKTGNTTTGIFNFSAAEGPILTYGTDQFVTFCIDLDDTAQTGSRTWDVVGLANAPDSTAGPMGDVKAASLAKLLGAAITSGVLNDARNLTDVQKQALQLAIWEVVHEGQTNASGEFVYDITGGSMKITSGLTTGVLNQATAYLNAMSTATAMGGLVALTSTANQDFIGQVPIPAAAWLFGSALLGIAALGRRNRKQTEESETLA